MPHISAPEDGIALGTMEWSPLQQIANSNLYRSKTSIEIDGIKFCLKAILSPFNFKDHKTSKLRDVVTCDIEIKLENPEEKTLSLEQRLLPLKILDSEVEHIAALVEQFLKLRPELKLERSFDINLGSESPLFGLFPETKKIGIAGKYQLHETCKIREDIAHAFKNQMTRAGESKPTLYINLDSTIPTEEEPISTDVDEESFDDALLTSVQSALNALSPSDITPETAARAITLHIVDYAISLGELTPNNYSEILDEYSNWAEGKFADTITIPARLAMLALAPAFRVLKERALLEKDEKKRDSLQVLNNLSNRLQNPDKPSLSVGEWLYTVYALSCLDSSLFIGKEQTIHCNELETRMLNLSLIRMFDKSFEIPPGTLHSHFERAQTQWRTLQQSSEGAITILTACSELAILILEESDKYRFNPIYRLMRNRFTQQDGKAFKVSTSTTKNGDMEFERLGLGWAQPLIYLCGAAVFIKDGTAKSPTTVNTNLIDQLQLKHLLALVKETPFKGSALSIQDKLSI